MYSTIRKVSAETQSIIRHLKYLTSVRHNSVLKSSLPDVDIPNVTIPEFVLRNFLKYPHKIAVECNVTGRKFTFEEILFKSRSLSNALRKRLRLAPGDIVAVVLPNVPEFPICILGSLLANLIVTTINPIYTPHEISRQLQDTEAKAIFTLTTLTPKVESSTKLLNRNVPIITVKTLAADSLPEGTINLQEFIDSKLDVEAFTPSDCNNIALLPYSSGTTGLPKGVALTHRNIVANMCQLNDPEMRLYKETSDQLQDIVPGILPFFHIFGLTAVLLLHLSHLCKLVTLPKFSPEQFIHLLINHKPQILFIVPPIVSLISNQPAIKKEYMEPVRVIVSGAAPLGLRDEEKFICKVGKQTCIKQGYGLTETSPAIFMVTNRISKLGSTGTVGEIVPNTYVKLIKTDGSGHEISSPLEIGEIFVKGPQVMKGYYKRDTETNEAFRDGWFKTGDIAYYDEKEMFYISERVKELIKVKGFQVAPTELEEVLRHHPDITDAVVIGVPHKHYGEVPKALLVPKSKRDVDIHSIQRYMAENLAEYKQLKGGIEIVDSIPRSVSGKILRKQLREKYQKSSM